MQIDNYKKVPSAVKEGEMKNSPLLFPPNDNLINDLITQAGKLHNK